MSVVPNTWLFRNEDGQLTCRWTAVLSKVKEAGPCNPNWRKYDIKRVIGQPKGNPNKKNSQMHIFTLKPTF